MLAGRLGLVDLQPIVPSALPGRGIGRVGRLPEPTTLGRLARELGDILPPTAGGIRVAGEYEREVRTVAVCAGAGDAYLAEPAVLAADVYVTSDLRHHPASEARENGRDQFGTGARGCLALGQRMVVARDRSGRARSRAARRELLGERAADGPVGLRGRAMSDRMMRRTTWR